MPFNLAMLMAGPQFGMVNLTDISITDAEIDPPGGTVGVKYYSNGKFTEIEGSTETPIEDQWASGYPLVGYGDNYEIRATLSTGDAPTNGDSLDTWLALSSDRTWSWVKGTGIGSLDATLLVEIRHATSLAVVTSHTVTAHAETT